jgi:hypothetical protein
MLVLGPEAKVLCRLNPDGTEVLYLALTNPNEPSAPVRLQRVPVTGGPPRLLLQLPFLNNFQCSRAPANVCLLSQQTSQQFLVFRFDPITGNTTQIKAYEEAPTGWSWSVSPDGKSLAFFRNGSRTAGFSSCRLWTDLLVRLQ